MARYGLGATMPKGFWEMEQNQIYSALQLLAQILIGNMYLPDLITQWEQKRMERFGYGGLMSLAL